MPHTPESNNSLASHSISETPTETAGTSPSTLDLGKKLSNTESIKPRVRTGIQIDDYFVGPHRSLVIVYMQNY